MDIFAANQQPLHRPKPAEEIDQPHQTNVWVGRILSTAEPTKDKGPSATGDEKARNWPEWLYQTK